MKTVFDIFWALIAALVMATAASANTVRLVVPGGRIYVSQRGAQTVLTGTLRGRRLSITLPADDGIYPRSFESATLIGKMGDDVLLLSTDYVSHPGKAMGQCGASSETMLRVIALRPQARQTFKDLVDSCWNNIESIAIGWDATTATLKTEFTTTDGDVFTRYKVLDDGVVRMIGIPIKEVH
jgi:hypothetical protein